MGHWNNEKVRCLFPSVAWGALCLALVVVSLYVWGEYDAYRLKCEIGVLSDSVDDLHVTLFSVYVVVASAFLALSLAFCGDSLRKLRRARAADAAADVRDESTASALARLDAALNDLHVDVSVAGVFPLAWCLFWTFWSESPVMPSLWKNSTRCSAKNITTGLKAAVRR